MNFKILECENKIYSLIESVKSIERDADLLYANDFFGKTSFEAAALVKSFRSLEDKLQVGY